MKVTERKLGEWLDGFAKLYEDPDNHRKPEHFWIGVMAHFSGVGENIRKYDFLQIYDKSAHAICWLLCFANKLKTTDELLFRVEEPIERLVGFKFPMVCGHCLKEKCICSPYEKEDISDKTFMYSEWIEKLDVADKKMEKWSIRQWMEMYKSIFAKNTELRPLDSIGFHLLEEGGEGAKAIRLMTQFRGVENDPETDIDREFFESIVTLSGMVEVHKKLTDDIMSSNGLNTKNELREYIKSDMRITDVIKWRIVDSKINLISEYCDSFSWLCTLLVKCERVHKHLKLTNRKDKNKWLIENTICKIYDSSSFDDQLKCYACRQVNCSCIIFSAA